MRFLSYRFIYLIWKKIRRGSSKYHSHVFFKLNEKLGHTRAANFWIAFLDCLWSRIKTKNISSMTFKLCYFHVGFDPGSCDWEQRISLIADNHTFHPPLWIHSIPRGAPFIHKILFPVINYSTSVPLALALFSRGDIKISIENSSDFVLLWVRNFSRLNFE